MPFLVFVGCQTGLLLPGRGRRTINEKIPPFRLIFFLRRQRSLRFLRSCLSLRKTGDNPCQNSVRTERANGPVSPSLKLLQVSYIWYIIYPCLCCITFINRNDGSLAHPPLFSFSLTPDPFWQPNKQEHKNGSITITFIWSAMFFCSKSKIDFNFLIFWPPIRSFLNVAVIPGHKF